MVRIVQSNFHKVSVRTIIEEVRQELRNPESEGSPILDTTNLANQDLHQDIQAANQAWQINLDFPLRSHRRYLGPWIVRAKKLLRRIYRWYFAIIAGQIVDFQGHIIHSINGLIKALEDDSKKINSLVNRMESLEGKHLAGRIAILESNFTTLNQTSPENERIDRIEACSRSSGLNWSYIGFEEKYRGSEALIKESQIKYADYFKQCRNVVDLGCGRGEFLDLLRERGISCKGIDNSPEMVAACSLRGLDVILGEIRAFLRDAKEESLDGIFMAFVIEHLPPRDMIDVIHLCYSRLCKNGRIAIITDNPKSLSVGGGFFWIDLTHVRPVHPETLQFLMQETGFTDLRLEYLAPYPQEDRLIELPIPEDRPNEAWMELMNSNLRRLNETIFGFRNYSILAVKK